jgi:hypothetical protein
VKLKLVLLVAVALCVPAGVAHAAPVSMVVRDVPLHGGRELQGATPHFNLVGLHWQGSGTPSFRARSIGGRWTAWQRADDDWGRDGVWRKGDAEWTGASDAIQVRTQGQVSRVREYLLWSPPVAVPSRRIELAGAPVIISRAGWQANEEIRRGNPRYAPTLKLALVHHTVTANAYSCAQSASIVRGIETYHVLGNGWDDIGYNFLVDACGQIFEGRYGGITRNVIGAHSEGFNTGTTGVALIGNYQSVSPTQAEVSSLVKLLAWRLDVAHVDPLSTVSYVSGGNPKYRAGTAVSLRAISGHRDTYPTECPGNRLYALLPSIAKQVAATGGPKLYAPQATGTIGGPIRFTGKLSTSLRWTITVTDVAGNVATTHSGTGTAIDWTWDSQLALPGVSYTWTISAPNMRGATGTLYGGSLAPLTMLNVAVTPSILNPSVSPTATVSYVLSVPATVTGELIDSTGTVVAQVFGDTKLAGVQTSVFSGAAIPDGSYTLLVTARDVIGRQAQATLPITVSRTLLAYSADTTIVSPNGDGRRDTATFRFTLTQATLVTLSLADPVHQTSFPFFTSELTPGQQSVAFTGRALDGTLVPDGSYLATLTTGSGSVTLPLTVDTVAPRVTLVSVSPLTLRVYEQVTIIATVDGREIRASRPAGLVTLALQPGEVVQTLSVVVRDAAGNESPPVTYPPGMR